MRVKHLSTFFGTIISAILASICCIGPLILAVLGIGSIGAFSFLERYRPLFICITFTILGVAFYLTYRKEKKVDPCCDISEVKKRDRIKKVTLWVITAIAVGLVLFPYFY